MSKELDFLENTFTNEEQIDYNFSQEKCSYLENNIIKLNTSNFLSYSLDENEFYNGIKDVSRLCGKISALCNVGITPDIALSYIANLDENEKMASHNLEISKINADSSIEMAKYGAAYNSKMTI